MRYVRAQLETARLENAYKIYMSDSIYQYAHNKMLSVRFEDVIKPKPQVKKSAQAIVDETFLKAGLKFKE